MAGTGGRGVTIAGQRFELRREAIERAMRNVLPEPIASHYAVIGPRRYPPKQVIALATGLDRADFTTHQARRTLMGLGFAVGRMPHSRGEGSGSRLESADVARPEDGFARQLADLRGQWVAVKDEQILVAAPTPREVVGWLAQHDRRADSMFRVPEDEIAVEGWAPL